jgi:hypothetical protein
MEMLPLQGCKIRRKPAFSKKISAAAGGIFLGLGKARLAYTK